MAAVALPMLRDFPLEAGSAVQLHMLLRQQYEVEVPVYFWAELLWVRISAQMYNTLQDYQALEHAVVELSAVNKCAAARDCTGTRSS